MIWRRYRGGNAMENEYFAYAGLIGIRQGVFASIPWRNVHRTAPLRHGIQLAQVFLVGGCAVAQRVHRTGPYYCSACSAALYSTNKLHPTVSHGWHKSNLGAPTCQSSPSLSYSSSMYSKLGADLYSLRVRRHLVSRSALLG